MSIKKNDSVADKAIESVKPIPENLPEELLPLYDWWKAKGIQSLTTAGIVILVALSVSGYLYHRKDQIAEANIQLIKANSLEELEAAVAKFGNLKAGNAIRLRLAKSYYDSAKYQEALETYEECEQKGAPEGFEDVVTVGRAHCFEALEKHEDALSIYQSFAESNRDSFLYPQAVMGMARVLTMLGRKPEAANMLEELKAEKSDDSAWEMAIASLEDVINHYEPRAKRSLFDMAEAAEKTIQKETESGSD